MVTAPLVSNVHGNVLYRVSLLKYKILKVTFLIWFIFGKDHDLPSVPFALGKVIDIIYSMDQLKGSSLEQQKQEISKRLKWVCLGNVYYKLQIKVLHKFV